MRDRCPAYRCAGPASPVLLAHAGYKKQVPGTSLAAPPLERREVLALSASPRRLAPHKSAKAAKFTVQTNDRSTGRTVSPAEKARQGEIVLRHRWQRIVFIGGLAGCVLLVLILWFWMAAS